MAYPDADSDVRPITVGLRRLRCALSLVALSLPGSGATAAVPVELGSFAAGPRTDVARIRAGQTPDPQVASEVDTLPVDSVAADTLPATLTRAQDMLDQMRAVEDTLLAMEAQLPLASEEEAALARVRALRLVGRLHDLQSGFLDMVPELEALGIPTDSIRDAVVPLLTQEYDLYVRGLNRATEDLAVLRGRRSSADLDELVDLDARILTAQARMDSILVGQLQTLDKSEAIGLDVEIQREEYDAFVLARAEAEIGRLELAQDERNRLRTQLRDAQRSGTDESDLAALRTRVQIAEQRVVGIAGSITATADLLDSRGVPTAQYRQYVIRATGEVTSDILDPQVLLGLARDAVAGAWTWVRTHGPTLAVRLLILLAFIALFRLLFRLAWWVTRLSPRVNVSRLLAEIVRRMLRPAATVVGLVVGLGVLGVDATALLAGMGVLGVILGLALQDSMSNLAAGLFILVYRPYDVDDVVTAGGVVGKVRDMGLANTTIVTFDNRRMHVPNRKIWNEVIENRSAERVRRAEAIVRIGFGQDLDHALDVMREVLAEYDAVLGQPEPSVFTSRWADSWIEVTVWAWTRNEDWWSVTTELPRRVRIAFEERGLTVPLPQWEIKGRDDLQDRDAARVDPPSRPD